MDQVRHEAIRLAVEACSGHPPHRIMDFAREIEAYLLGRDKVVQSNMTATGVGSLLSQIGG